MKYVQAAKLLKISDLAESLLIKLPKPPEKYKCMNNASEGEALANIERSKAARGR